MKLKSLHFLPLFFLLSLQPSAVTPQEEKTAPYNDSIRQDHLKADLYFLAGDGMQGRLTGTQGNFLAGDFIKSRFERIGLAPAGTEGSYYHPYNLMKSTIGEENLLEIKGSKAGPLRPGQDWYPLFFSASGRVEATIVYAGFGITDATLSYDDYRGVDLHGKVALVLDHEPGERDPASPFDGVVSAEIASPLRKTLLAQERGAAGVLFVRDVHNHTESENFEAAARNYWPAQPPRIDRYTLAAWAEKVRIPAAQISPVLAAILVRETGRTLADLARAAETAGGMAPAPIPASAIALSVTVNRQILPDRNVLGAIEGGDPRQRNQYVIVCAHYDHNGADGSQIYNGADDDGSGIVGLIEIAEAYALAAQAGQRPRRSILFAAWNAEERGLFGAWAYADNPLVPLENIVALLNLDMIGRNEEVPEGGGGRFRGLELQSAESNRKAVNIIGTVRSPDLRAVVEHVNQRFGLDLRFRYDNNISNLMRRSDHWPFLQRGIPALWFHTGLHPDYHTVYDRPERINYAKMEKISRLVHEMSWRLAEQDSRPRLVPRKKD